MQAKVVRGASDAASANQEEREAVQKLSVTALKKDKKRQDTVVSIHNFQYRMNWI